MKTKNFFWGLFFILAAAFIIINQIGLNGELSFIKVTGGILFLAISIEGCIHRSFSKTIFSLAFIGILFASELGIESLTPWPILLVALLLSIGISILFPNHNHKCCGFSGDFKENVEMFDDNSETITCYSKFGGSTKYINSDNFRQAEIISHFGGMKLYFNNAVVQPGVTPVIKLDCSFSGVEIQIPANWKIENNASSSFGAIEEKNHEYGDNIIEVRVIGSVSFSGIEIYHV